MRVIPNPPASSLCLSCLQPVGPGGETCSHCHGPLCPSCWETAPSFEDTWHEGSWYEAQGALCPQCEVRFEEILYPQGDLGDEYSPEP